MVFGQWTVLDRPCALSDAGERKWLCRCACGTERYVRERSLLSGGSQSCGCMTRRRAAEAGGYDLRGRSFGNLIVVGAAERRPNDRARRWKCRCGCGRLVEYPSSLLVTGKRTSCGCGAKRKYACADIQGKRFHRLTALYPLEERDAAGYVLWHCRCDCGKEIDVSYNRLVYGNMRSCGCQKKEYDQALQGYLTHVAGTCVDMLKSDKLPKNNTTGVRGVYRIRGKYVAKIVFQKKQYHLGSYDSLEEAALARREAEEQINGAFVEYFEKWERRAREDAAWAEENPIRVEVGRDGQNRVELHFEPAL